MAYVLVALVAAAVLLLVVVVVRRRRAPDTVATFQRQIDALSAEARRPVVDQVTQLERDDGEPEGDDDEPTDDGRPDGS